MRNSGPVHDKGWAAWVRNQRKLKQWNRRKLAFEAGIDPSYVTLIERDGMVPRRDKVLAIGDAFFKPDEAMIVAGYTPIGVPKRELLASLDDHRVKNLIPEARELMELLRGLAPTKQVETANILLGTLKAMLPKKLRGTKANAV